MSRRRIFVAAGMLSAVLLAAWSWRPDDRTGPCVVVAGPATLPEIPEASGLAVSRRTPGVLWSHNDSENAAVLFALDNAEALFVIGSELYIATKDRTGGLYRSTLPTSGGHLTFQRVGELGLVAVTDAETSPDGASVVVRTPDEVVVYRTADLTRGSRVPSLRVRVDGFKEPQGEGVALAGDILFLASEGGAWTGGGSVVGLRCNPVGEMSAGGVSHPLH